MGLYFFPFPAKLEPIQREKWQRGRFWRPRWDNLAPTDALFGGSWAFELRRRAWRLRRILRHDKVRYGLFDVQNLLLPLR